MPFILLALSTVVLTLEVLETKIFAYCLANNLMFLVIGMALLGIGAGGTALSLRRSLGSPVRITRASLLMSSVLVVAAHAYFAHISVQLEFDLSFTTISTLVALSSPYFAAGMAIAAILAEPRADVTRLYGMNLLGSALGCCTIFLILGPLTGPQCLAACASLLALLGASLCRRRFAAAALSLALGVPLFVFADVVFPYQPEPARTRGQLSLIAESLDKVRRLEKVTRAELTERFDRWDPTARIQVHSVKIETTDREWQRQLDETPNMWFTQDSSYGSPLVGNGPGRAKLEQRTCYGAGYFRGKRGMNVLIIGLGGAPDVQTALHSGAAKVTGVDINKTTVDMVRGPLREFLGDPYGDPRVHIVIRDGRSFVRGDNDTYDLIQLSGVDTKSIMASGTLAVNESYLYTREAYAEYIARLAPDGMIAVIYAGEDFMHRHAITAMAALKDAGAAEPYRHVMLIRQSQIVVILIKRSPFTGAECKQMDRWLEASRAEIDRNKVVNTGVVLSSYELLESRGRGFSLYLPPVAYYIPDGRPTASNVMRAAQAGRLDEYLAKLPVDLTPVRDDRPFFFHLMRTADILGGPPGMLERLLRLMAIVASITLVLSLLPLAIHRIRRLPAHRHTPRVLLLATLGAGALAEIGLILRFVLYLDLPEYFQQMRNLALVMSGLAIVLIVLPLAIFKLRGLDVLHNAPFAIYFAALGAGFVLAEIGLIQRYVLYLGHQAYAFPVVIGGLLVSAGLGSMWSGRFDSAPQRVIAGAVIAAISAIAAHQLLLDDLFAATASLGQGARVGVATAALLPLGAPLGMLFPTGLRLVKQTSPLFVSWAFGINGVFSVLGSTIVVPGALLYGFPAMAATAAAIYVLAGAIAVPAARRIAGV